jgi:hypothetical protein
MSMSAWAIMAGMSHPVAATNSVMTAPASAARVAPFRPWYAWPMPKRTTTDANAPGTPSHGVKNRAGLLTLTKTQQNRGAVEKYYEAASRQMWVGGPGSTPSGATRTRAQRDAWRPMAMTLLEQARQEIMNVELAPSGEKPLLVRVVVAAPADQMPKVRARLLETVQAIRDELHCDVEPTAEELEGYDRWALTIAFAAVNQRKHAR